MLRLSFDQIVLKVEDNLVNRHHRRASLEFGRHVLFGKIFLVVNILEDSIEAIHVCLVQIIDLSRP